MAKYGVIRKGDKTSCGGTVMEGDSTFTVLGKEVALVGATISCRHGCQIIQGWPDFFDNRRLVGFHGCQTTQGCRCLSTASGQWDFDDGTDITTPDTFVPENGEWLGVEHHAKHEEAFDEYFILADETGGSPARNRLYRITLESGDVIEGYTDKHGRTTVITSDRRVALSIEVGRPQEIQVGD